MKIALFGGSFDPPHQGHESVIKEALNTLEIDRLIIMPAFISPFKESFSAPAQKRLEWVVKLWGKLKGVEICDFEIKQNRPVPSIESVNFLYKLYQPSKFYLLVGADHLATLASWHCFEELKQKVEFVIAKRDEIFIPKDFKELDTHIKISSSFIREYLNLDKVSDEIQEEVKKYYQK
ncbi:nicotinate (nicotinamide) nucleotide adenylyltransferase [Campylobacter helveticus]|uniref:Probable nicotinate-nucleotide adenylyltransferase n=1 Tax=Campylobacter helveticus TaxID=28898 RepID=A0AAX2UK47_9BACT|nr:nicotinate (nicotinamide) nucleotide adenylyltransferase [Campylobacter helveticus]ARE79826.1 nicotinate-mononucleotide adenylyltransferase [Campylobacter helveticus]MCR2038560.1 nicotinate (nicotinamide) nucleotide adenylyltransferase [Campylobacter helveticus]MCR2054626.1 nicotinate (nicotinamide) nucleotide adenylyltransferase [Campylobacter helveticus]MCR2056397.1 nicotinate (nicotinamide) nucleotide adenylyltransferase [Campylobacter helveticus]MCR2060231.1 nicotinate (nicotinamide) nu